GKRPDKEQIQEMKDALDNYHNILGYHDLLIHKYGPSKLFVTVDVEIDSNLSLIEAHKIIDGIENDFKEKFNIDMVGHIDPIILDDKKRNELFDFINELVISYHPDFHFHDFQVTHRKKIWFDL